MDSFQIRRLLPIRVHTFGKKKCGYFFHAQIDVNNAILHTRSYKVLNVAAVCFSPIRPYNTVQANEALQFLIVAYTLHMPLLKIELLR